MILNAETSEDSQKYSQREAYQILCEIESDKPYSQEKLRWVV